VPYPVSVEPDPAVELLLELLKLPGKSCEERPVIDFIRERIERAGLPDGAELLEDDAHRRSPFGGNAGNLIVRLPGRSRQARRLLSAHVDTVPLCVGCQPVLRGRFIRSASRSTGLGADNRSGAAVLLLTLLRLLQADAAYPPLTFVWTVQEELGLHGSRLLQRKLLGNPQLGFNWDGNEPHLLTIGATGAYRIEFQVQGLASHAGVAPERGVSAAAIAALAIAELQKRGWHGRVRKGGHSGTANVGVIEGGRATNIVADRVAVRAEVRSHDPAFRKRMLETYLDAFSRAAKAVRNESGRCGRVKHKARLEYESFRLSEDSTPVRIAAAAVRQAGLRPGLKIANGGLDANWLTARIAPTVTLGAGQRDPHAVGERLHVPSFLKACQVALHIACGQPAGSS